MAIAADRSPSEVLQGVTIAVEQGLIVAVEEFSCDRYRCSAGAFATGNWFRFLHDRIQQAAFDCIPERAKKAVRLQIGRS